MSEFVLSKYNERVNKSRILSIVRESHAGRKYSAGKKRRSDDRLISERVIAKNIRVVKTACPHDCPDTCSMLATVEQSPDGTERLLSVAGNPDNPYTRGNLCRKVAHYEERVYSPDRLLTRCGGSEKRVRASSSAFPGKRRSTRSRRAGGRSSPRADPKRYCPTPTPVRWAW